MQYVQHEVETLMGIQIPAFEQHINTFWLKAETYSH